MILKTVMKHYAIKCDDISLNNWATVSFCMGLVIYVMTSVIQSVLRLGYIMDKLEVGVCFSA